MKNLIYIFIVILTACSGKNLPAESAPEQATGNADSTAQIPEPENKPKTTLQLNNGNKWKADSATLHNAGVIVTIFQNTAIAQEQNRDRLIHQLKSSVDLLVSECRMQGPEHEALHVWLEQVLEDLDEVREAGSADYQTEFNRLKKDVELFNQYFD